MRILIIGLNFAPELTGVGKYTGEMASWLAARGHAVSVITTHPYYPQWRKDPTNAQKLWQHETWHGCTLLRCPLYVPSRPGPIKRVAHLSSFALSSVPAAIASMMHGSVDIVCGVVPTILSAPVAWATATCLRAKSWIHIQDLEIEAASGTGIIGSTVVNAALQLERSVLRRFHLISTISPKMLESVAFKGVPRDRLMLFPNWVDIDRIFPLQEPSRSREQLGIPQDRCVALYSGSFGRKQGLETIVDAARWFASSGRLSPLFVLAGEGPGRGQLENDAKGLANVIFLPLQPVERLNDFLNMADIHLLPQRLGATDLVMPSKLGAMMATGKPVIATVPPESQVAITLRDAGIVARPEDPKSLAGALAELMDDPERRENLGRHALVVVREQMEANRVLERVERRLHHLVGIDT